MASRNSAVGTRDPPPPPPAPPPPPSRRPPPPEPARRERLRGWTERLAAPDLARWAGRLDTRFQAGGRQRAARGVEVALLTATLPAHDVHGRPSMVQLPKDELERRFGRT